MTPGEVDGYDEGERELVVLHCGNIVISRRDLCPVPSTASQKIQNVRQ